MSPIILVSPKKTTLTFATLMGLLALTFWTSHLDLGRYGVALGLVIALVKALLVVLYFMQTRYERGLVRVAAGVGVFWLGILILLTLTDYLSRDWLLLPGAWPSR